MQCWEGATYLHSLSRAGDHTAASSLTDTGILRQKQQKPIIPLVDCHNDISTSFFVSCLRDTASIISRTPCKSPNDRVVKTILPKAHISFAVTRSPVFPASMKPVKHKFARSCRQKKDHEESCKSKRSNLNRESQFDDSLPLKLNWMIIDRSPNERNFITSRSLNDHIGKTRTFCERSQRRK